MKTSEEIKQGSRLWLRKQIVSVILMLVTLFWPAGTMSWSAGWLLVGMMTVSVLFQWLVISPRNPDLFAERSKLQPGSKKWDVILATLVAAFLPMITWIISGLDFRYNWSERIPLGWMMGSAVIWLVGYGITLWAMMANTFFSATVRIQTERGHHVIDKGPYGWVRHPGYLGALVVQLTTPVVLGSWWAWIPSVIALALFTLRTRLEDNTLKRELPGYEEYASRVRFRLFPGIW
jgi:protein-S-isoprenylcysteine O-methyltransferase Ste14